MKIYGLKTCDTCRKALKSCPEDELVDVREAAVPASVMDAAWAAFGTALLNTRSTTWRGLSAAERAGEPLALIAAHPALMKRPLIVEGDRMTLGWDAASEAQWLGHAS